jgi:hypothetical protein
MGSDGGLEEWAGRPGRRRPGTPAAGVPAVRVYVARAVGVARRRV